MEVIFGQLIFTEKILMFIRQNTIPYGQRHYQCLWPYGILFGLKSNNGVVSQLLLFYSILSHNLGRSSGHHR